MLKHKIFRSNAYRLYVASLPCAVTGYQGEGVDPHHIKGRGYGGTVKCSDLFCIPLRHDLHQELHQIGWQSWDKKHNFNQLMGVLTTFERAVSEGRI